MGNKAFKTYRVNLVEEKKFQEIQVHGDRLGDLRAAIREEFAIPPFEQSISFSTDGQVMEVQGDDTVLLAEKPGLLEATQLRLLQTVDFRYKMEKETAFNEALVHRRFQEAKDILSSSGVTIDVNCIYTYHPRNRAVTESPCRCAHPALTVAIQAGLGDALLPWLGLPWKIDPEKIQEFMSQEKEVSEVIQLLIEKQADVNATGNEAQDCESNGVPEVHRKSPLAAAVQRGSPLLVKLLLDAKADPNHEMKYDSVASGKDTKNPFGPGVLRIESWADEICNGSVRPRQANDPRNETKVEILALLTAARQAPC